MMDEKKIDNAASKYANVYSSEYPEAYSFHDGFIKGIEWFRKNLWHDAGEEPTKEGLVIAYKYADDGLRSFSINWLKTRKDFFEIVKKNLTGKDAPTDEELEELIHERWREFKDRGLQKWCYLEDLLRPEDAKRTRLRAMLYCIANKADEKKTMNQTDCNRLSDIMPQEGGKP